MKSKNIFLDKTGVAKIADFGLSTKKLLMYKVADEKVSSSQAGDHSKVSFIKTGEGVLGTYPYIAPEIMKKQPFNELSDIFGFGWILWEISANKTPYHELTPEKWDEMEEKGQFYLAEIPKDCPPLFSQLIKECWNEKPNDRPQSFQLISKLQHLQSKVFI